jgi:DNA-binding beta-propeller fold protein YncE
MKSEMIDNKARYRRAIRLSAMILLLVAASSQLRADTGTCSGAPVNLPFTDVMGNPFFCQIAQAYFSGLTVGTTATTYSPTNSVPREEMAAFISRTMDQALKRGSRRAVAKKWWTPQTASSLTLTNVGTSPQQVEFDGTDLWVTNYLSHSVMRIRPSDGKVLDTWTGATNANGIVCAMGRVFVTGFSSPGRLYMIDPTQPAGAVTTVSTALGNAPRSIAFDGSRLWTTNDSGSISIVTLNPTSVTTVSTGFLKPYGLLFDGSNIWVTDSTANTLFKLDTDGSIAQTINVGSVPVFPVFDGTNIWVPNYGSSSATVVRVKDAQGNPLASAFVLATLTGNGLNGPETFAFDGERVLVTNGPGHSVSLWKAADLAPLGSFPTGAGTTPVFTCSDGLNFWIALATTNKLARF